MFQSSKTNAIRALVALTFADGRTDTVSVRLPLTSKLNDALNSTDAFLDVVNGAGKQYFVAKSSIASVELIEVPKASQLNMQRRTVDREQFDPYEVLGVASDAEHGRHPAGLSCDGQGLSSGPLLGPRPAARR